VDPWIIPVNGLWWIIRSLVNYNGWRRNRYTDTNAGMNDYLRVRINVTRLPASRKSPIAKRFIIVDFFIN
jgi:hypothetical protein